MGLQVTVSIGYRDIFDDYEKVNITDLLKTIPTQKALEVICYFLTRLHTVERNPEKQIEFLELWLRRLPNSVYQRVSDFIAEARSNYVFINNISGLILIENILENRSELEDADLTPEQELDLFKAYLYCSQVWIDKQYPGFEGMKINDEEDLIKVLLPTQLPFQEILEFKDFRLQFIKAIYFFKFCEQDAEFKRYLEVFLNEYKLDSWQKYLLNLVSIYVNKIQDTNTSSIVNYHAGPDVINFLEQLSIDVNTFKKSDDFMSLREKPVYKVNDKAFIILNLNFLVDKLYHAIQFDFARVLVANAETFKGKQIKRTLDFMSIFGNEFSEVGLFYSVMKQTFGNLRYKAVSGKDMKPLIGDGEPDYYIRDKSKVYIFEFKNIFLGAKVKHSNSYDEINAEVFKKLVSNEDNSAKGVTQLVNVIEKIRKKEFSKLDNYDFGSVKIYPIIVYVDFSFNIVGSNYILNKEFKKQLAEREISDIHLIKDLTLIDVDTFIKFQDLFRDKKLKLGNCLNEYYAHVSNPKDIFDRISTFNMFIHHKTKDVEYDSPTILMDEVLKMMPPA